MGDREEYLETSLPLPPSLYGRSLARSYADVITKFSRLDGLPIFLTHGASLARFARWSSAIIKLSVIKANKYSYTYIFDDVKIPVLFSKP